METANTWIYTTGKSRIKTDTVAKLRYYYNMGGRTSIQQFIFGTPRWGIISEMGMP